MSLSFTTSPSPSHPLPPLPLPHYRKVYSLSTITNSQAINTTMSSRRSSRISEEEMNDLVSKLQSLLPETRRRGSSRASASKLLKETCNYIKSLHREVDDLSDRLSGLMSTMDGESAQAEIIRSLLRSN